MPRPSTGSAGVLAVATAGVLAVEAIGLWLHRYWALDALPILAGMRVAQIVVLIACAGLSGAPEAMAGPWQGHPLAQAIGRGAIWSAVIGAVVAAAGGILFFLNIDARGWIRVTMPTDAARAWGMLALGGIIGPVAEELYFRGIVYSVFRRWGICLAVIGSTGVFAALHWLGAGALPIVPAVGGLLFAAAYECERHLAVPMVIHILGNLTLFGLSWWR